MKKIDRFIIKSFAGPLVMTFFITLMVLLLQFLWKYIDDLVGKDLGFSVLAEMIMYVTAGLIPMSLPLANMLAALMTFGNLGEHFELTAIKAAGVSLQRMMRPLFIISFTISVGAFLYSNYVMPYTNLKMRTLIYSIQQQRPELQLKEGAFTSLEGFNIRIGKKNKETGLMHDIMVYDHRENKGNGQVTVADSGYLKMTDDKQYLVLTLFSGAIYEEMPKEGDRRKAIDRRTYPQRIDRFQRQDFQIELKGFGLNRKDESIFKASSEMLNMDQLIVVRDSVDNEFQKRKDGFRDNLLKINYMSKMKPDSIYEESRILVNLDTAFVSAALFDKTRIYESALSDARGVKSNISTKISEYKRWTERVNRYGIEWHRKIVLSLGCFIFFFIGAPLGAIIRKGGMGMPVVISVVFFIMYYIISLSTEKMARKGSLTVAEGMWVASVVLLPIGLFLTYKATSDSGLFKPEVYKKMFTKVIKLFKK
jgi:lipopolysaccharide export system permease protein